jgi:hypothetical protein
VIQKRSEKGEVTIFERAIQQENRTIDMRFEKWWFGLRGLCDEAVWSSNGGIFFQKASNTLKITPLKIEGYRVFTRSRKDTIFLSHPFWQEFSVIIE